MKTQTDCFIFVLLLFNLNQVFTQSCRRDNVAIEETGRLCPAPCTRQQTCRSENKVCRCDGECGFVCIPIDLKCPPLEAPVNGFINVQENFTFGSVALYSCNEEHFIEGSTKQHCQGDATWSGTTPLCLPKPFCSIDHLIRPNGCLLQIDLKPKYFENEKIRFICARGYFLNPNSTHGEIVCQNSTWLLSEHTCEPKQCVPTPLENGLTRNASFNLQHHLTSVKYSCAEGYKLIGSEESFCDKGYWVYPQGRPYCHNVQYEDEHSESSVFKNFQETKTTDGPFHPEIENSHVTIKITDEDFWNEIDHKKDDIESETREGDSDSTEEPQRNGCYLTHDTSIQIFHQGILIPDSSYWLPERTRVSFRCKNFTHFQLRGSRHRRCSFSEWSGTQPKCLKIIPNNIFSPPLITYQSDDATHISSDGDIEIIIGSTLYLSCYYSADKGKLTWKIPNDHDYYEEKWNDQLNTLTLIVYFVQEDDSGIYTCTTPVGRSNKLHVRVIPFIPASLTDMENELVIKVDSTPSITSCEYKSPPNVVAKQNGVDVGYLNYLPDGSVIHLQCKEPTLYALRGPQQLTCHEGEWVPEDDIYCERLLRNSEHLPPPINVTVFGEKIVLQNGTIVIRPGLSVILDCLWVYPEPGEGWYYPTWFQTTSTGDVELPAEIIQHDVPTKYGRYYSYRLSFTVSKNDDLLMYTCMATTGLKTQIHFKISDFCLLTSLKLSPSVEVDSTTLKLVYFLGEIIRFNGCKEGVLVGPNYSQCVLHNKWLNSQVDCHK